VLRRFENANTGPPIAKLLQLWQEEHPNCNNGENSFTSCLFPPTFLDMGPHCLLEDLVPSRSAPALSEVGSLVESSWAHPSQPYTLIWLLSSFMTQPAPSSPASGTVFSWLFQ
jgi:hypothetical protein